MQVSDLVPSLIRTWVPLGMGALVSWLATKNFTIDAQTQSALIVVMTAAITGLYYTGVRLLEQRYPAVGRVLLGFGVKAKPVYVKPADPQPKLPPG